MTTQIKGLMFAAAVATFSAACGTSGSPTGMDVSGIEASAGFSAVFRTTATPLRCSAGGASHGGTGCSLAPFRPRGRRRSLRGQGE